MEYRHYNLFGGQGEVLVHDLLMEPPPAPFTSVLWCRLAPLGTVGRHSQQSDSELLIVTSGEGLAHIDDVERTLSTGVVVGLPLGATLALTNTSSQAALEYLIVKAGGKTP